LWREFRESFARAYHAHELGISETTTAEASRNPPTSVLSEEELFAKPNSERKFYTLQQMGAPSITVFMENRLQSKGRVLE
jgi:hypothetical protein